MPGNFNANFYIYYLYRHLHEITLALELLSVVKNWMVRLKNIRPHSISSGKTKNQNRVVVDWRASTCETSWRWNLLTVKLKRTWCLELIQWNYCSSSCTAWRRSRLHSRILLHVAFHVLQQLLHQHTHNVDLVWQGWKSRTWAGFDGDTRTRGLEDPRTWGRQDTMTRLTLCGVPRVSAVGL